MTFKIWLTEMEDKGYNYYKNVLLGKLNLDRTHGLSQGIDTWEPEQLISTLSGLGEFTGLPKETQDQVLGQIRSRMGTLGDLIRIMASPSPRILQSN
jgi:hypothetical protein